MESYNTEEALYYLDFCVKRITSVSILYETLFYQVEKRLIKNKDVTIEHLEKCSSMYNLVRFAEKRIMEDGGLCVTRADKRAYRHKLAAEIVRDAKATASLA